MKIKSLGYKVIDEESGIEFELVPKKEGQPMSLLRNSLKVSRF